MSLINSSQRSGLVHRLGDIARSSIGLLLRAPQLSRQERRANVNARRWGLIALTVGTALVVLMHVADVASISMMPPRGSSHLWPVALYSDLAKSAFVLWALAIALVLLILRPGISRGTRADHVVASLAVRTGYVFASVALAVGINEILKGLIGRARPFVGGTANAFFYTPFTWDVRFASFPSGHAVTAFALAYAIGALWPKARLVMWAYAALIAVSRVVLLAHHPSDVVAGATVGIVVALMLRNWFASRRLAFTVEPDGTVRAKPGPSWRRLRRSFGAFR